MTHQSPLIALFAVAIAVACDRPKEPSSERATTPPSAPAAAPATAPAAGGTRSIKWTDPPRWQRAASTGPMRKASYQVPPASGDDEPAELAVFHFGRGQGGSIEANVERWTKQFSKVEPSGVKRSQRNPSGLAQHIVEIEEGTFSSGMPGGPSAPKPGWALLGAIVEGPDGNWFFKLTGPRATVTAARTEFFSMLDGIKATP